MKKVSIAVYQEYIADVIRKIYEAGYLEIIDISRDETKGSPEILDPKLSQDISRCTEYELRLSRLITLFQKYQKKSKGIRSLFTIQQPPIQTVQDRSLSEIYTDADTILKKIENPLLETDKRIGVLSEEYQKVLTSLEQVKLLRFLDFDLSHLGQSSHLFIVAGMTTQFQQLEEQLKNFEFVELFSHQVKTGKKTTWVVVCVVHRSEQEKFEKVVRDKITFFDLTSVSGSPKEAQSFLEKEKKRIEEEQQSLYLCFKKYRDTYLSDLYVLREELQLERIQIEIKKNFSKTKTTYVIQGWVIEKNQEKLRELISETSQGYFDFSTDEPSMDQDTPPTYLETPRWAQSFQMFLELFATPKYNELNPTIFMGLFLVIFFGFMLGDAGYGLVILVLSLFGFIKFGKQSSLIRQWSFLGLLLGVSTIIVGLLTNSFFGDFIPRFIYHDPSKPLYSLPAFGLPLEPLRDPLTILTIALIFGLIHLNVGILLGILQAVHHKNYREMLTRHIPWIPLQLGGGILIGNFILGWTIDTSVFFSAILLTIGGLLLLFIHDGPLGFFGITGYVGDWLSYARLLALGLATSGMALAFNVIGELAGIILMPIILILAHTANVIIQALGAGVHALRLQYVEFFNRFYEGGGRTFTPFKIKRIYTKIEEK
ncbi:MAG: V-type ATP synthase subunit I [Candidatus Thermoplasmatota archaeon]